MKVNLLFLFVVLSRCIIAQNYQERYYSENISVLMLNNPAFSGAFQNPTMSSYLNFGDDYTLGTSFGFNFQTYLDYIKGGIGITINHNVISGPHSNLENYDYNYSYSPSIKIMDDIILKPAFGIGNYYNHKNYKDSNGLYTSYTTDDYLNMKTGLLIYNNHFYLGFACDHINTPSTTINETIYPVYIVNAGINKVSLDSSKTYGFYFNVLYEQSSRNYESNFFSYNGIQSSLISTDQKIYFLELNGTFRYKGALVGLCYYNKSVMDYHSLEKINAMIGFQYKCFRVSLSRDLTSYMRYNTLPQTNGIINEILLVIDQPSGKHFTPPNSIQVY